MAGRLVLVNKHNFDTDGSQNGVSFTGLTSSNPYKVIISGLVTLNTDNQLYMRITKSGNPQSTANYQRAGEYFYTFTAGSGANGNGETQFSITLASGYGQSPYYWKDFALAEIDLFNLTDANSYDYWTSKCIYRNWQGNGYANNQGGQFAVASASDGIQIYNSTGASMVSGTIALYEVI